MSHRYNRSAIEINVQTNVMRSGVREGGVGDRESQLLVSLLKHKTG